MILVSVLNVSLKPLLIILTIPITIVTLGLFLIIINGLVVLVADYFIDGIYIGNGLWGSVLFSLLLSLGSYVTDALLKE